MDIEKKALELVNAVRAEYGAAPWAFLLEDHEAPAKALYRAIEAHEADNVRHAAEMEAFRREVSEAAEKAQKMIELYAGEYAAKFLARFIIPRVDPLVEAWNDAFGHGAGLLMVGQLKATLAARGLELVKKEPSQ